MRIGPHVQILGILFLVTLALLDKNLVVWSYKEQPTVSRSSWEPEYRALANVVANVVWLSHLLRDLRVHLSSFFLKRQKNLLININELHEHKRCSMNNYNVHLNQ